MSGAQLYEGREHAVPCKSFGCKRMTWRADAYCVQHRPVDLEAPSSLGAPVNRGDGPTPPGPSPQSREQMEGGT